MTNTLSGNSSARSLGLSEIDDLAAEYDVPIEDVLLIAINLYGIFSGHVRHRARVIIRLISAPAVPWQVIVPLNAAESPFSLTGDELSLGSHVIGHVQRIDADEAVGGYFRNGGRAATLNPNARSRCTGCAFCPNTLEAAADPRFAEEKDVSELLDAMQRQHPRRDLTELQEITVSTGCFEREVAALAHLTSLRRVLTDHNINARIGFLTSVVRTDDGLHTLADRVAPFVLRLTIECFTRRELMLKASKANLLRSDLQDLLMRAQQAGLDTSFTYIVGLDPLVELRAGLEQLTPYVTEFPNFQVFQAHNSIMAGLRSAGADDLRFYLNARREIEWIMDPSGLRPQAWEGYRPLWYFMFAGEELVES